MYTYRQQGSEHNGPGVQGCGWETDRKRYRGIYMLKGLWVPVGKYI